MERPDGAPLHFEDLRTRFQLFVAQGSGDPGRLVSLRGSLEESERLRACHDPLRRRSPCGRRERVDSLRPDAARSRLELESVACREHQAKITGDGYAMKVEILPPASGTTYPQPLARSNH